MSTGELLLLLYDELVNRATMADILLKKKEYPQFEDAVDRCIAIVKYLDETLDKSYPVSMDIARMYEYFVYTLGRIKIGRNQKLLDHIRPMLTEFRDTFRQAEKESTTTQEVPVAVGAETVAVAEGK